MSSPYNPAPGGQQSGDQPQWSGYSGANYPPQNQPGYPGQDPYQQGGYGQGGYPQQGGYGGYQQGGYQQGNYPQQSGGYGYGQGYGGYGNEPRQSLGIVGLSVAAVGAIVLIIGFFLNWYSYAGEHAKFSDIHKNLDGPGAPGFPKVYFGWLAWALLALVIIAAVLANLPLGSMTALVMRTVAPVLGLMAIAFTLMALNTYWDRAQKAGAGDDLGIFKHSAIGLYLTLAGFLIVGIGGIFGPRRA